MAEELFIPKLGQTVEEVTLVKWLVEDGSKVSQGQPVMEVETDKAVFPLEANANGTIHVGPYKEGQVMPVLTVVAIIGKPEDRFEVKDTFLPLTSLSSREGEHPSRSERVTDSALPAPTAPQALRTASLASPSGSLTDVLGRGAGGERIFVSPRARKLAAQQNIDLTTATPTGLGGLRVVERDVLALLAQIPKATPVARRMAAKTGVDLRRVSGTGPGGKVVKEDVVSAVAFRSTIENPPPEILERIPLKGVRLIIAERMAASVHTTARVTLVTEADATEFVAARTRIKEEVEQEWGFAPGYNDLLAKIVAAALRRYPYMNARLAHDAIEILGRVNLGMAVESERGLLVPVIHDADRLSLRQLGAKFRQLTDAVHNDRILPDDLTGGTFTITNLGMYEIDAFTPVINLPEAAILGAGRIAPRVVPYNGEVAIRQMWTLSLVFDHRLVDGAPAARFLQEIKHMVEEPYLLLTT